MLEKKLTKKDIKNIYDMIIRCSLAYDDGPKKNLIETVIKDNDIRTKEDEKDLKKHRNMYNIKYFDNKFTSTHFNRYVPKNNNKIVYYSFRGSDTAYDWIKNFEFFRQKIGDNPLFKKNNTDKSLADFTLNDDLFNNLVEKEYQKYSKENFDISFDFFRQSKMGAALRTLDPDIEDFFTKKGLTETCLNYFESIKNKIYLHSGFVIQYNSIHKVFSKQFDEIAKYINEYEKVVIEGHSLGSSIARIAYVTQLIRKPSLIGKVELATAGSPRIGNRSFEQFCYKLTNDGKLFTNVNVKGDFVNALPPLKIGFCDPYKNTFLEQLEKRTFKNSRGFHSFFYYMHILRKMM